MPDAPTIPGYTLIGDTLGVNRFRTLTYRSLLSVPLDPTPTPVPIPTPTPDGIRVPVGKDWRMFVKSGATVLLPRGATFTGGLNAAVLAGITLGSYGDPKLLPPKIVSPVGPCLNLMGGHNLTINGIDFIGNGLTPVLRFAMIDGLVLRDCGVTKGSFGVVIQVLDSQPASVRNRDVHLIANRIIDNDKPGGDDSSGLYIDRTDGIEITGNVFDHNGWSATSVRTMRNHNVYIHGSCSPAAITGNVFANAASHGLQARSGGVVGGNVFLDNPIHLSYGLVNGGGPVFAGGVTGAITDNVLMGSADIAPNLERGMAIQVGNVRQLTIARNWIGSDNGQGVKFSAISVERCNLNPDHHGGPDVGVLTLTVVDNRVDWRGGPYRASVPVQHGAIQGVWGGPLKDVRSKIPWGDVMPKLRDGRMKPSELLTMAMGMM